MDIFLHRANRLETIKEVLQQRQTETISSAAPRHHVDGLEIDLRTNIDGRYLSHDKVIAGLTFGRHGIDRTQTNIWFPRRVGRPISFSKLMHVDLPLWIDLKGTWTDGSLKTLAAMLRNRGNEADMVASLNWDLVNRYPAGRRERLYTTKRKAFRALRQAAKMHASGIAIRARAYPDSEQVNTIVATAASMGLKTYFCDPLNANQVSALRTMGANGVCLDNPSWANE